MCCRRSKPPAHTLRLRQCVNWSRSRSSKSSLCLCSRSSAQSLTILIFQLTGCVTWCVGKTGLHGNFCLTPRRLLGVYAWCSRFVAPTLLSSAFGNLSSLLRRELCRSRLTTYQTALAPALLLLALSRRLNLSGRSQKHCVRDLGEVLLRSHRGTVADGSRRGQLLVTAAPSN